MEKKYYLPVIDSMARLQEEQRYLHKCIKEEETELVGGISRVPAELFHSSVSAIAGSFTTKAASSILSLVASLLGDLFFKKKSKSTSTWKQVLKQAGIAGILRIILKWVYPSKKKQSTI